MSALCHEAAPEAGLARAMSRVAIFKFLPGTLAELTQKALRSSRSVTEASIHRTLRELLDQGRVESDKIPGSTALLYRKPQKGSKPAEPLADATIRLERVWPQIAARAAEQPKACRFECRRLGQTMEPDSCIASYREAAARVLKSGRSLPPCATCPVGAALRRLWAQDEPRATLAAAGDVLQAVAA